MRSFPAVSLPSLQQGSEFPCRAAPGNRAKPVIANGFCGDGGPIFDRGMNFFPCFPARQGNGSERINVERTDG